MEPRAWRMLGKQFIIELHPESQKQHLLSAYNVPGPLLTALPVFSFNLTSTLAPKGWFWC
jgi:hypothetical protein